MKGPVRDSATFSFNAAARTVTFTAPIPAQQAYILGILNVTRNIFIYLPVEPGFGGTYNSGTGVLTLAFDTTTHANGDVLQIIFDDTQSGATAALQATGNTSLSSIDSKIPASPSTAALQTTGNTSLSSIDSKATTGNTNTAGIRTDLGTDGTSPPILPGGATGVRGWLRWLGQSAFQLGSGVITAITLRVTLATDGPGVSALASISGLAIPAHDHITLTYTGTNLTGVQYRTGGPGGTIVGTLTLAYNGSNLISVTRS